MPKLTKRFIDTADYPKDGQIFLRDAELPGFALRLTQGSKVFILEKRIEGRNRRITIGPYGALTLEQARDRARELIGQIAKGEDPAQEKKRKREEETLKDLWEDYKARYFPRLNPRSTRNYDDLYRIHLTPWQNRKLSSITRSEIARLHSEIGKSHPYAANRMIALLRRLFNVAHILGFHAGDNPAVGIELFKEEKRDRFLNPKEVKKLMAALAKEPDPFIRGSFLVMLMTGQRKTEVLTMQWSDVDLKQGVWRIPKTKANRPHYVPLPRPVLALLDDIPRFAGNPFVFCGRVPGRPLNSVKNSWERIRVRAGIKDARIHDLRRTLGSWLAGSGASLPLIGKALNHTQPSTTAIYARMALDPVREALEVNAQRMLAITQEKSHAKGKKKSKS